MPITEEKLEQIKKDIKTKKYDIFEQTDCLVKAIKENPAISFEQVKEVLAVGNDKGKESTFRHMAAHRAEIFQAFINVQPLKELSKDLLKKS